MSSSAPSEVIAWLMEGPAFVRYRTRLDLLGHSILDAEENRSGLRSDEMIVALVKQCAAWPWPRLVSHKSAGHPIHKLEFLTTLGLGSEDRELADLADQIAQSAPEQGPFRIVTNVSPHYGGTGQDTWAWSLCDAPSLTASMNRLCAKHDPRVRSSADHLLSLCRANGWPCAVSLEMGKFRGPGRKDDPCPYATLTMLELLSELDLERSEEARRGVESLLDLWDRSRESHPFQFYMGTDFRKLKAPFVWYDIMHVAEVLTRFDFALRDERLAGMAGVVRSKADAGGRFTPESVWTDWKDWDFGQKKEPSRWLTLCAYRMLARGGW
jgi:hypothetical protein